MWGGMRVCVAGGTVTGALAGLGPRVPRPLPRLLYLPPPCHDPSSTRLLSATTTNPATSTTTHHPPTNQQFAFNTLQRVSPVSHGVCNVVKRVVIIFSSVLFFKQVLTQQALVGTVIALAGTWAYTEMSSRHKAKPKLA